MMKIYSVRCLLGGVALFGLLSFEAIPTPTSILKRIAPKAYFQWVNDPTNGLHLTKSASTYDYIIQYTPLDYLVLQRNRNNMLSKVDFKNAKKELKGMQYYSFFIALNDGRKNVVKNLSEETKMGSEEMVKYLAYRMQEDLKLIQGVDTLDCQFMHMEETYEVTPYVRFFLAFDEVNSTHDISNQRTLLASLPWLEGTKLTFIFEDEKIKNIPKVIVKNN